MAATTILASAMMMKMILVKSKMLQSMKKKFSRVMLVAAAAMAFFACQKPEVIEPETSEEVMLTFSSEKPAFDDETKTEWTGETIQWSQGDKISVAYTVGGDWQGANGNADGNAKLYKSSELAEATEIAKFNVSTDFKGTTEGAHVFYGVYPAPQSTDFANAPVASLTIPANQTPNANTFDASGDLMVGVSKEYESRPGSGETISLKWNRLVAHAVITLKEINGFIAGETLTGITLTAQEGANLVGKQNVDLTTGAVENNDGASNIIKIAPGSLSVDANGTVTFWVCVLPETLTSLTVEIDTDQATYTRKITGISKTFKQNARNTLAVNMSSATRVTKETESWVLVTPADGITEGTYALVASTSTKTGVLVSTNGSSSAPAFNTGITIEDNVLKGVAESMQFDIAEADGGYTLAVAGQTTNYLYTTATNNGVRVGTNANKIWTIGTHADNSSAFVFKCNATSRFLGVYNNSDWRCYTSYNASNYTAAEGSSEIYLYKKTTGAVVPDTTPSVKLETEELELAAEESEGTIWVEAKNIESIEVRALPEAGSQEECDWLVAEYDEANSCVTYSAEANETEESRTAYIEVYALDADGNEIIQGVNVTQKGQNAEPEGPQEITVADFLDKKDTETEYILTGKITNVANTTYGNFDLTDATGKVYVYGLLTPDGTAQKQWAAAGLKQGDIITIKGKYNVYNNSPQVKNAVYVSHKGISVDNSSLTFAAEGGYQDVTATLVNATDAISVSVDNPHFTVALKSGNTYTVTAPANETEEDIYANLTFTAGELTTVVSISQDAPEVEGEVVGGRDDFSTVSSSTSYGTHTSTAGWKATNSAVLQGGSSDSNPTFKFIGSTNATRAFCINGKKTAAGTITSPTLTTGCGTLKFNYGLPYSDTKIKFRVDIKQNGTVVKTFTVDKSSASKLTKYTHEEDVNVSGDFQIVFTNLSPSSSTSNKDRTAIWDVEWTGCN